MNEADYQRIIPVIGPYEEFPETVDTDTVLLTYVTVDARFAPGGEITPLSIYWENGKRYEVEAVRDMEPVMLFDSGMIGVRYICQVLGKDMQLYYGRDGRWCVERRQTE